MAIYEIKSDTIKKIEQTSFGHEKIQERKVQKLLRDKVSIVCPDSMVIAEEFSDWEDSNRRIDLLALDKDANIVVIELKRSDYASHMELQATRYAAMVSAMTFDQVIEAHADYIKKRNMEDDAEKNILNFLQWNEPKDEEFAQCVRVVLVSADFSKELTTTVMWLNQQGLDICCVRLKPYNFEGHILLDVQQIIPLPEAAEYQVKLSQKEQQEKVSKAAGRDRTKYNLTINGNTQRGLSKRKTIYLIVKHLCDNGVSTEKIGELIQDHLGPDPWRKVDGKVDADTFAVKAQEQAEAGGKAFDEIRWFCNDAELIYSDGKTYAFSNQWGKRTDKAMELLLAEFPDKGVSCEKSS